MHSLFPCTVVSTVTLAKPAGFAGPDQIAGERLSCSRATNYSSPIRWRQSRSVEPELHWNNSAAERLIMDVLNPALAHLPFFLKKAKGITLRPPINLQEDQCPSNKSRQTRTPLADTANARLMAS